MARPRTFEESDVVAAARDTFWTRGYAATSVDDLTAATGLGKGSLYGAFGDKHGLFLRALESYADAAVAAAGAELRDSALAPGERLAGHIRAQAARVAGDRARRGCLLAKSAAELGAADGAVERTVSRAYAAWRAEIADCIRAGQSDGELDPARDPQVLATTVLAFLRGLDALHKGGVKPAQIKSAAEEMVGLVLG